jgi:hypothetical protein
VRAAMRAEMKLVIPGLRQVAHPGMTVMVIM